MSNDQQRDQKTPKRPYEAPAVEEDETFETLALACGKASGITCIMTGANS